MKTFILVSLVALCGCQLLEPKAGPYIAKTATKYCQEPAEIRTTLRNEVNKLAAPNAARICCAVDGPVTACTQP